MSEAMNLPESLGRLEINPERVEPANKAEKVAPLTTPPIIVAAALKKDDDPESSLQALSLKAECPKGSCQCNKKREKEKGVKRLLTKRPILRKSKLNVLKALQPPQSSLLVEPSCLSLTVEGPRTIGGSFQTTTHPNQHYTLPSPSGPIRPPRLVLNDTDLVVTTAVPSSSTSSTCIASTQRSRHTQRHCCAVQARLEHTHTPSDDTNIDELASYFDLFVHIPKKMSRMAEMMYI